MRRCVLKHTLLLALGAVLAPAVPAQAQFGGLGSEYLSVGYEQEARHNPIARLQRRLASGEVQLEWKAERGYFDSLLEALDIDPSSQVLVFSPTSLQYRLIGPSTPRAIYFSDDTYVAYVQNSTIVEITTMDEQLGSVFYVFNNAQNAARPLERENERCLVCHDSSGLAAGGVPLLLARSGLFDRRGVLLEDISGTGNTTDATPIAERWGGWYVTGQSGQQSHLGNVVLSNPGQVAQVQEHLQFNIDSLANSGLFNTAPYPRDTSDIVALMVLEHQLTVQNQVTYVKFKAPMVLQRTGHGDYRDAQRWIELPAPAQKALSRMLDKLVDILLFVDAAPLADRITGDPAFAASFQARGKRDAQGRSLRDFDLETRLFKYPLSYLVASADFDALPPYAKDYVYQQINERLRSGDTLPVPAEAREAALAILSAIKDDFAPYATPAPTPGA